MTKKIISFVLSVMMIVSLLPMGIFADDTLPAPTDEIVMQPGKYYDAEWVALDGQPIKVIGDDGIDPETYAATTDTRNMSLMFEVKGVTKPFSFGKVFWNTLGKKADEKGNWTEETTSIESSNSQNYKVDTKFDVPSDGAYTVQFGFANLSWVGTHFSKVSRLVLFENGNRGSDFVSENTKAQIRILGVVEGNYAYNITFCDTEGDEVMNVNDSGKLCAGDGSSITAVPSLESLYTGEIPTKAETEQYRYAFIGWQSKDGTPVEYANFTGKVYPRFREIDKSIAVVTFVDGDNIAVGEKQVKVGETVSYDGKTPDKTEDNDNTYVFKGWKNEAGEAIDLATYKIDQDQTITADFVPVMKTKAIEVVTNESVKFNSTGEFAVKLNTSKIVLDALENKTSAIKGGTLNISTNTLVNESAISDDAENPNDGKNFTVTFDSVDEEGYTNGVFNLTSLGYLGKDTLVISGEVYDADGNKATVYENSIGIATDAGKAPDGQYYDDDDAKLVRLPSNDEGLKETEIWSGDVDLDRAGGATFVLRATGIKEPMIASALRVSYTKQSGIFSDMGGDWAYSDGWTANTDADGKVLDRALYVSIPEDGYYFIYISKKVFSTAVEPIINISKVSLLASGGNGFKDAFKEGGNAAHLKPTNPNSDAKVQLLAIVKENLVPVVTFMNGKEEVATGSYAYSNFNNTADYLMADKTSVDKQVTVNHFAKGTLVSPNDIFAATGVETPTYSDPDKPYLEYTFDGWADENGNLINVVYKSGKVYAHYSVNDKRPDCTVEFKNYDGTVISTQTVKGATDEFVGDMPVAPETAPKKPSDNNNSYIFKGWDLNGDGEVDDITAAVYADGATITYTAVYEATDRMWEVSFYTEKVDGAESDYIGMIFVRGDKQEGEIPAAPAKAATPEYTYTFDKWVDADGKEVDYKTLSKDVDVYATYTATKNNYTVTFLNEDGTEYKKIDVPYGEEAKVDAPTKEGERYKSYEFAGWVDNAGNVVSLESVKEAVTVKASFKLVFASPFTDVLPGADGKADPWFYESVAHACLNGYMDGTTPTTFEPEKATTRAMLVRVLYNIENAKSPIDTSELENPFTDVLDNVWYTDAIKWAASVGVVDGMTPTTFNPDGAITREQFCTILYRYADKVRKIDMSIPKADPTSLSIFSDRNTISAYAVASVKWCVYMGAVSGYPDKTFKPKNGTKRNEMAKMLMSFDQAYESGKIFDLEETPAE